MDKPIALRLDADRAIAEVGEFDNKPGSGIAVLIDVQDAVGVAHQVELLSHQIEDKL